MKGEKKEVGQTGRGAEPAVVLLALAAALGTITLCWAIVTWTPGAKFWSQEAAGWASAVATLIAIVVALTSSEREHKRSIVFRDAEWARDDLDREDMNLRARLVIAGPLADELATISTNVRILASFKGLIHVNERRWAKFKASFDALETTVFDIYSGKLEALPADVAHAVVTAYAKLRRVRSEIGRKFPVRLAPLFEHQHVGELVHFAGEAAEHLLPIIDLAQRLVESAFEDAGEALGVSVATNPKAGQEGGVSPTESLGLHGERI